MFVSQGSILGEYEILAPLGAGGMGDVYRARDMRLHREVAIKVLPRFSSSDPERLRRFELEARAAAALNHPNILVVYQMGSLDGVPYLVSELLEGETLRARLIRGALPWRLVVDYGVQIARGLAAAHRKGIVHRDLKPENLFITYDGQVKILDFGLALMMQPEQPNRTETLGAQTQPGILMGTVGYMSPEQIRGKPTDHRSDIFSFTLVLCEMLTGRPPFQKPTAPETMTAILHDDPSAAVEALPNVPPGLHRILQRGLEKDPERRFHSISDLAFALETVSDPNVSVASKAYLAPRQKARRGWWLLAAAAFAVVAAAGVIAFIWMRPVPVPHVSNYVQLTHDGVQKSIIGTDGSRLYLTLVTSAVQQVAAIQISGGERRNLSMPSPDMVPVSVSPDGSEFLIIDGHGVPFRGALWSLPVLGGSPRRLGETNGSAAAWSPDNEWLAYADGDDLFVARGDGTDPRRVLRLNSLIEALVWSPDGSHLRFDTSQGLGAGIGQHLLFEVSADGSKLHRLLPGWRTTSDECCGTWSADGKYFIFQSQGQIWALANASGWPHRRAQPIPLTASPMTLSSPLASKDGRKLFVVGATYRGELTRYDMHSGQFVPELQGISAEYVSFSKDGEWVAYVAYPEGTLWRSKADGSDRLQLTFPPLYPVLPQWSPDGKTLLFFEIPVNSNQPSRIYKVPSNGGTATELMPKDPHNQQDPNWSPDGTKIVFAGDASNAASSRAGFAIRIFDVASHQVSTVPGSQGLFSPRWSPDGRFLAAFSSDSRTVKLFDFATQTWTDIAQGTFGWLNWSKDGQYLYLLDFTGKGAVVRVKVADHKLERVADLTNFITTGQFSGSLTLAPDDSPLLLRDRGTQDVYALNWSEDGNEEGSEP